MGYLSQVTGEVTITPPIPLGRLADSPYAQRPYADTNVVYEIKETEEETDEGTLTRRLVIAIVSRWTDEFKAYHLLEHLTEAVRHVNDAGSACTGEIMRVGENPGDVERHEVAFDGTITTEKARLVWPDGTEVTL
jgi:hypothetical protein